MRTSPVLALSPSFHKGAYILVKSELMGTLGLVVTEFSLPYFISPSAKISFNF